MQKDYQPPLQQLNHAEAGQGQPISHAMVPWIAETLLVSPQPIEKVMTDRIVQAARSQIGAYFKHQGRIARSPHCAGWLDCLGLLMVVADQCQLTDKQGNPLSQWDDVHYGHYPNGEKLRNQLQQVLVQVNQPQAGDIALCMIDGSPRHLAIIADYAEIMQTMTDSKPVATPNSLLTMIHAYMPARRVIEHRLDARW